MAFADPNSVGYGPVKPKKKKKSSLVKKPKVTASPGVTGTTRTIATTNTTTITPPYGARPAYRPVDEADTWAVAKARASEISDPILRAIAQRQIREEERARADSAAQLAATQRAYSDAVAPTKAIYDTAIGQASTLNESVANRLAGQGQVDAKALADRLAQIGAPGASQTSSDLGKAYTSAAAVGSAKDTAEVQNLVSRSAEQQAFLEKQPGLAAQESAATLATSLRDIGDRYSDQRSEIEANIPAQIQQLYDNLFGQRSDASQRAYEAAVGGYEDKKEESRYQEEKKRAASSDVLDRQKFMADQRQQVFENYQTKREFALRQRALALEYGDKKAQRQYDAYLSKLDRDFKAQQAALDRQARAYEGQLDRDAAAALNAQDNMAGLDLTGPASQEYITVGGQVTKNPNYKPKPKSATAKKGPSNATINAARKAAFASITRQIVSTEGNTKTTKTGWDVGVLNMLRSSPNQVDGILNGAVNNALRAQGIDPNSAQGAALRRQVLAKASGMRWQASDGSTYTYRYAAPKAKPKKKPKMYKGKYKVPSK